MTERRRITACLTPGCIQLIQVNLFSGGTLGLFLGMSLISVIEVLAFILKLFFEGIGRRSS
jgi:hypothetical protein